MNNHAHVFEQAYQHLEPGGWIEAYDYNLSTFLVNVHHLRSLS